MKEVVAILGASNKPTRYSYKALRMLEEHGHQVLLIHPALQEFEGRKIFRSLSELISDHSIIDTVTVYVRPEISSNQIEILVQAKPKRVIFNPGAENPRIYGRLEENGIEVLEACTLVLLRTGQF